MNAPALSRFTKAQILVAALAAGWSIRGSEKYVGRKRFKSWRIRVPAPRVHMPGRWVVFHSNTFTRAFREEWLVDRWTVSDTGRDVGLRVANALTQVTP